VSGRDVCGRKLVPGVNVDRVDAAAGLAEARVLGWSGGEAGMVVEYALWRWARGEEEGADRTALSGGVDLTSWRRILAAALAAGAVGVEAGGAGV
jgi:hypothetical protein